ncbi:MAG: signal peptide peptidase SppA [Candidatus Aminicenantes bacterium]|nr:MAG: signal peptide peptidase SppA [Candidatus Aminicenantes bacterium]
MKKIGTWIGMTLLIFVLSACSPHFHLDLLGKEEIQEVVLVESRVQEKILLLDISGLIATSIKTGVFDKEGDILSQVYFRLKKAAEDNMVKGIILRLDTPGGEVTASDIIYHEILNFKQRTGIPVLALMMGLTASGGYYIASACDYLIAHPTTLTGSIGVISLFPNLEGLFEKVGIQVQVIKSGELKDSGSVFRQMTPEERDVFQKIIGEYHQNFQDIVYKNRKDHLSLEDLEKITDGRVLTASQALEAKLIDEIGYFDTALKTILDIASLPEAKVVSYTYFPKRKTNIYATNLKSESPLESVSFREVVQSLKSGFYYLWHPQLDD